MKTMGTRCALLLLGLAALLQLKVPATAGRGRPIGAQYTEGREDLQVPPTTGNDNPERGDVPGWVMITLMSAVLVAALLALAGPALEAMFNQAMDKVGN
jgi:hypothetical protein